MSEKHRLNRIEDCFRLARSAQSAAPDINQKMSSPAIAVDGGRGPIRLLVAGAGAEESDTHKVKSQKSKVKSQKLLF